jgi:hypothetical protein
MNTNSNINHIHNLDINNNYEDINNNLDINNNYENENNNLDINNNLDTNDNYEDINDNLDINNNLDINDNIGGDKYNRIKNYEKNINKIISSIKNKFDTIFISLNEGMCIPEVFENYNELKFEELMLELDISTNELNKLDIELNNNLIITSEFLGNKYYEKIIDTYVNNQKLDNLNNDNLYNWKNNLGKWMLPMFMYLFMLCDTESIINSSTFDNDYIEKKTIMDMELKFKEANIDLNGEIILD